MILAVVFILHSVDAGAGTFEKDGLDHGPVNPLCNDTAR